MLLIAIYILVFVAVFLLVATLFRAPIETEDPNAFRIEIDGVDRDTIFEVPWLRPVLIPLYHMVRQLNLPGFKRHVMKLLLALGNPHQYTADEYLVICVIWGGIGSVMALLLARVIVGELSLAGLGAFLVMGLVLGFFGGYLWLRELALKRLREIARRLPYALDLIAMAMDAGATFYEACKAVVRDDPNDPLNEELGMVVREIDFGRSRQDALTHLGQRINVEGLDSILSAVLQAEALGTPLAMVLKLQANLLRMRRSMRAERKAGEAAVKILVPSMLILMSVVIIIFAPVIVRAIEGRYLE
ncbi:MAG: type II secretion system F family protein [Planctomycetes bacterium]|nr:type II secretion system F family protein [Planctomycetota bacterium]